MIGVHADADVFPFMTDDEFGRLADDIELNGLLEPITLLDGLILDGRHRQRACNERGVEPRYVDWDPSCGLTPLEWVISKNLHRRQLTVSQRAALAVEFEERLAVAARTRMHEGQKSGGRGNKKNSLTKSAESLDVRSAALAGNQFGVSSSSVTALKTVKRESPAVFARVKRGEIGKEAARRLLGFGSSGGNAPGKNTRVQLTEAIDPLRRYLKNWHDDRLTGTTPAQARRLLKIVQEIDSALFELERALEARTVVSRALR